MGLDLADSTNAVVENFRRLARRRGDSRLVATTPGPARLLGEVVVPTSLGSARGRKPLDFDDD